MAKILVVDDEQLTVDMLTTFLELIGHETISALSGRQTWDRLAYEAPDAVLLDIMLPDSNGIDICRQLRSSHENGHLAIIMISAASPPLQQEAAAAGANDYLVKPINLDKLKKVLAQAGVIG
ncbi:MAG: response regulator [Anaerolineaceae bacterium]|nr:response regulator [Anaerolineaceae bacterium]